MKEVRYFYQPDIECGELSQDEAQHALRVLRLGVGDELNLMDGRGTFYQAQITTATGHRCLFRIIEEQPQEQAWTQHLHLAMAPSKLNDRTEWFVEKACEIGVDEFTFLDCQFSERRNIKTDRIDKIVVSAMKQSHKAWKPVVNEMTPFKKFIEQERAGQKFICHCYEQEDIDGQNGDAMDQKMMQKNMRKPHLLDVILPDEDCTVLVGPEGDFSVEEVRLAQQHGYQSVTLGTSRLRTETAALVAVHLMQLKHQK